MMVYDAAKSRVSGGSGDVGRVSLGGKGLVSGGVGGRFVSRSAPDASEGDEGAAQRERRFSNASTISGHHITTAFHEIDNNCQWWICLIFLLCWFQLGRKLHPLSRMLFRQSRLTSSCLLAANLWQLSISQRTGRV
jgi:hypothetical protein